MSMTTPAPDSLPAHWEVTYTTSLGDTYTTRVEVYQATRPYIIPRWLVVEHWSALLLGGPSDLYVAANPEHFWIKGDVTSDAHITLLYGLITPAYEQADTINRLLAEWQKPKWLPIDEFVACPSPMADEDYACIVANIATEGAAGDNLLEAHALLSYLPHVDTFPEYLPHATVAYIHSEAAERWLAWLNTGPKAVTVPDTVNGQRFDLGSAH